MKEIICIVCKKVFNTNKGGNPPITCQSKKCKHTRRLEVRNKWYKKNAKRIYEKYLPQRKKHWIGRQIAERLIKKLGIKKYCEVCGETYKLEIHHKDENTSNNDLSNLKIVCRNCHVKFHGKKSSSLPSIVLDKSS